MSLDQFTMETIDELVLEVTVTSRRKYRKM